MDLSMPVLDGMSATREIREFELGRVSGSTMEQGESDTTSPERKADQSYWPRITALTGLASTRAQIEARNAGIDVSLDILQYLSRCSFLNLSCPARPSSSQNDMRTELILFIFIEIHDEACTL